LQRTFALKISSLSKKQQGTGAYCHYAAGNGHGIGEYALIAGIVLMVSIPALLLLSGNLSNTLSNMVGTRNLKPTDSMRVTVSSYASTPSQTLQPLFSNKAPSGFYKGTGYYTVMLDPVSGKPVVTSAQTSQIDVAGSNGNLNTLGTILLAEQLKQSALQQTDPDLKDYYGQMARLSYYMGAAEGELDDVSTFDVSDKQYTNGDALQDIYTYHQQLLSLMQNPPAQATPQELQQVLPLATEVFNIGHNYVNNLNQFISTNGKISNSFDINGGASGSGEPGSVLTTSTSLTAHGSIKGNRIDQVIAYDKVKQLAVELLDDYKVESQPVKITLQDAKVIDTHSMTNPGR
jgi:hypothetical protein